MARAQAQFGPRGSLPVFISGHEADGAPSRPGGHKHLAFAFDAPRNRLLIIAPQILERREPAQWEREYLSKLSLALTDFRELRAGPAGKLAVAACPLGADDDPLFAPSREWESLTSYRVTRHARLGAPAAALEWDIARECRRSGLPSPEILVTEAFGKPGLGLFGRARLRFRVAVEGPLRLGRDRHFGGGLFGAVK